MRVPLTLPLFQPFPLQLRFDRGQEIFAHGAENDESDVEANLDVGFDENDFTTNVKEQHLDKLGVIRGREQIVRRASWGRNGGKATNTSHIIKQTGKMIKIDRNNAFTGLKFYTEGA